MSVRLEAANSEALTRATFYTFDGDAGAFTVGGYFYLHSLPAAGQFAPVFAFDQASAFTGVGLWLDSDGHLRFRNFSGGVNSSPGTATLTTGQWYYVWFRFISLGSGFFEVFVYLDESTTADFTEQQPGLASDGVSSFHIGRNPVWDNADNIDASFYNWKFWQSDVAASQAATESIQEGFGTAGFARWLFDDFTDIDDNEGSLDLTAVGTLSEGPADPWGDEPPADPRTWVLNDSILASLNMNFEAGAAPWTVVYWGPFASIVFAPAGNDTTLAVSLVASATMAAALATQIEMAAALLGSGVVSAALTTDITMAAALQATATLAALLSTDITMAVTLLANAIIAADLSTDIMMSTLLTGVATLSAGPLSGVAADLATTLFASGSLVADLSTDITMATSLTAVASVVVALATEIHMAADLLGSGNLVAALVTDILMATSLSGTATLNPDLTAGASGDLATSLVASASVAPDLSTDITMSASMIASAVIAAGLTTDIRLATALDAIATMAPTLATDIQLAVSLQGNAQLSPDLSTAIEMAASLTAAATLQGELATDILLAATLLAAATLNVPTLGSPAADLATSLTARATISATLSDLPFGVGALAAVLSVMPDFSAVLSTLPDLAAKLNVQPDLAARVRVETDLTATAGATPDTSGNPTVG